MAYPQDFQSKVTSKSAEIFSLQNFLLYGMMHENKHNTVKWETLARFLILQFGEFGKDRQIKNLPI